MKPVRLLFPLLFAFACSSDTADDDTKKTVTPLLTVEILSPAASAVIDGEIDVDVKITGPVIRLELYANDQMVSETAVPDPTPEKMSFKLDAGSLGEGTHRIFARAAGIESSSKDSDPIDFLVDQTAPEVAIGLERMEIVYGTITVPLTITEANVKSIKVIEQISETELFSSTEKVESFAWDTTTVEDRVQRLTLEVTDAADHVTRLTDFPVLALNTGRLASGLQYYPSAEAYVPTNYQNEEYHTRALVSGSADTKRVIVWMTWDASEEWLLELAVGQGFCPHRGIRYLFEISDSGEIIIDLPRSELAADIVDLLPAADRASDVFPNNNDAATFGSFFAHVSPMEPEKHIDTSIPIEIKIAFVYDN